MSRSPSDKLLKIDHLFGDAPAFAREPQQIFGVNNDRVEPVDLAEPFRAQDHSDIVDHRSQCAFPKHDIPGMP
jgi:hypothetical protein